MPPAARDDPDHDHESLLAETAACGRATGMAGIVRFVAGGIDLDLARQPELDLFQKFPVGRAPQPVVPNLMEPARWHVLEEAGHELLGRQGHGPPAALPGFLFSAALLVAEGHFAFFAREDAIVGNGDAVDVTGQVSQDLIAALDGGFGVNHPILLPDLGWKFDLGQGFPGHCHVKPAIIT